MSYIYFIGIDIAKENFEVALHNSASKSNQTQTFANKASGFKEFLASLEGDYKEYFIVLEATGGYEMELLLFLCDKGFAVHRLQTLKASHFLRSLKVFGKNDALDSIGLARLSAERHADLPIFMPPTSQLQKLQSLNMRRDDLIKMCVAEKQRLSHPRYKDLKDSLKEHYVFLEEKINDIDKEIAIIIENCLELKQKKQIMTSIKGIGEKTSNILLTVCPELGTLNRRQIASIAGVAPHPKESGSYQGYRSTKGGRHCLKRALFMVVLSAKSYNKEIKEYYERLIGAGKKKMVAITACMRKLIVIINAKIRDFLSGRSVTEVIKPKSKELQESEPLKVA